MIVKVWKVKLIMFILGLKVTKEQIIDAENKQYNKGLNEYGKTLKQCSYSALNWQNEALLEVIDAIMYSMKNNHKL